MSVLRFNTQQRTKCIGAVSAIKMVRIDQRNHPLMKGLKNMSNRDVILKPAALGRTLDRLISGGDLLGSHASNLGKKFA